MAAEKVKPAVPGILAFAVLLWLGSGVPVQAYDFEPVKPLDTRTVDPALLGNIYGAWEIRSRDGTKRCRIVLLKDSAIGGFGIEVAADCAGHFPVMADVAGWRLLEGWTIDLIDPLRKTRIRFETPDNRCVAFGDPRDIAGMAELVKVTDESKPAQRR